MKLIETKSLFQFNYDCFELCQTSTVFTKKIMKRTILSLAGWGYEPNENWGILATKNGRKVIPSEQGRYHDYYEAFAEAVKTGSEPPVTAVVGARTLAVLDAARQSALKGRSITLEGN